MLTGAIIFKNTEIISGIYFKHETLHFSSQKTSIVKKQSTTTKPELDTEQSPPPFAGLKLKKATPIKRESQEETLPFVELKHHEFEIPPQDEEVQYP